MKHLQFSFALRLIDFETSDIIRDKVVVKANGKTPVLSSEGYFIFSNITESDLNIEVKSKYYNELKIKADKADILKINLIPRQNFHKSKTGIKETLKPFEMVYISNTKKIFNLTTDISEKDKVVKIYAPNAYNITKCYHILIHKNGNTGETVFLNKRISSGIYETRDIIKNNYPKHDYKLMPLTAVFADSYGELNIPVNNIEDIRIFKSDIISCPF